MKKAEIITEIGNNPSVLSVLNSNPPAEETIANVAIYDIPILYQISPNMSNKGVQTIAVVDEGDPAEQAFYHSSKRLAFPHRQPHATDAQYTTGIENNFPSWTVLSLQVTIEGEFDRVQITASNGTNVIKRQAVTWRDDADNLQWELIEGQSA